LSEDLTRHWFAETILAIEHMHDSGYVHRDIKPENILVHEDRHVRVTDFGTIRKLEAEEPEQAKSPFSEEMGNLSKP
jgi:serine/threonine protein kinase